MAIFVNDGKGRERSKTDPRYENIVHYLIGDGSSQPMGENVDYAKERNAPSDVAQPQPSVQPGIPPGPELGKRPGEGGNGHAFP